ncbi:MAG: hypothetical protein ACT4PV_08095 [Planctomycetaceae bacterium]
MKLSPTLGPIFLGALVLTGGGLYVAARGLDSAGVLGVILGGALGAVNLGLGWWATARALRKSPSAALRAVVGGFFVRLVALVALVLFFQGRDWIDATAFALAFMVFFVVFLALEVNLVQRNLNGTRRPA